MPRRAAHQPHQYKRSQNHGSQRQQRLRAQKTTLMRKRIRRLEIACYGIIAPAWLGLLCFIFYAVHAHLHNTYHNALRGLGPGVGAFICCTCIAYAVITDIHACKQRLRS